MDENTRRRILARVNSNKDLIDSINRPKKADVDIGDRIYTYENASLSDIVKGIGAMIKRRRQ